MTIVVDNIKWIMLAAGLLTLTSLFPLVAPRAAMRSMFGESLEGPLGTIVTRSWSALIVLVGVMLVWGAFVEGPRTMALVVAGVSKLFYAALLFGEGRRYLKGGAVISVTLDLVMVALFAVYLATAPAAG